MLLFGRLRPTDQETTATEKLVFATHRFQDGGVGEGGGGNEGEMRCARGCGGMTQKKAPGSGDEGARGELK